MCDLKVPFVKQGAIYECWLAALKMLVKYRDGADAEPAGYAEVLQAGLARQRERDAARARFARPEGAPENPEEELERRRQQRDALKPLPSIGLAPAQFPELARRNGLRPVTWPATAKWTKDLLVALLREHGPVWCALNDRLHVIVLKGITSEGRLIVHDPEADAGDSPFSLETFNIQLLRDAHSMMYLPAERSRK